MENINNMLLDFGWPIVYFMAFLLILALTHQICKFAEIVLKWYKRYKF